MLILFICVFLTSLVGFLQMRVEFLKYKATKLFLSTSVRIEPENPHLVGPRHKNFSNNVLLLLTQCRLVFHEQSLFIYLPTLTLVFDFFPGRSRGLRHFCQSSVTPLRGAVLQQTSRLAGFH